MVCYIQSYLIAMQEYIFLVGKADPLDASLQSIRRAGYKVGIFQDTSVTLKDPARFDQVIPLDFTQSGLLDVSAIEGVSIVGLLATYENYIPAKSQLGTQLGLPVLSHDAARHCTDKLLMRQAFAAHDPALSPAFLEIASVKDAVKFGRTHGYPVIIKPGNLVKSLLVSRCDDEEQLAATVRSSLAEVAGLYKKHKVYEHEPKLIIEQFMEGDLYSVAAFATRDGSSFICPGITALTSAQQAGYDDNFLYKRQLPARVDARLQEKLFDAARQGMAALRLHSSAAHVELMHTREGAVRIIEIGARIGGYRPRMYNLSYGTSLLDAEVAVATDTPIRPMPDAAEAFTAVYELFPRESGRFDCLVPAPAVETIREAAYSLNVKVAHGDACGPAKEGHKAAAVIIITSSDEQQFAALCATVETIEVQLL